MRSPTSLFYPLVALAMLSGLNAADVCIGSSVGVPAGECAAWTGLYDTTAGAQWTDCTADRLDPCACGRVTCSHTSGVTHIVELNLFAFKLTGPIPSAVSGFTNLATL